MTPPIFLAFALSICLTAVVSVQSVSNQMRQDAIIILDEVTKEKESYANESKRNFKSKIK